MKSLLPLQVAFPMDIEGVFGFDGKIKVKFIKEWYPRSRQITLVALIVQVLAQTGNHVPL